MDRRKALKYVKLLAIGVNGESARALVERKMPKAQSKKGRTPQPRSELKNGPIYWYRELLKTGDADIRRATHPPLIKENKYSALRKFNPDIIKEVTGKKLHVGSDFRNLLNSAIEANSVEEFMTGYALASMKHKYSNLPTYYRNSNESDMRESFKKEYGKYNLVVATAIEQMVNHCMDSPFDALLYAKLAYLSSNTGVFQRTLIKIMQRHGKIICETGTKIVSPHLDDREALLSVAHAYVEGQKTHDEFIAHHAVPLLQRVKENGSMEQAIEATRLSKQLLGEIGKKHMDVDMAVVRRLHSLSQ